MAFTYHRTVRFGETDAAGVMYFSRLLEWAHEVYETSLMASGVNAKHFFSRSQPWVMPIVETGAKFFQPMSCGDRLEIVMRVYAIQESEFRCEYEFFFEGSQRDFHTAQAFTRHVCIDQETRKRRVIPPELAVWLKLFEEPQSPS
ncbi:MAG: acyl-CoA thioesterase [Limnothrix sp. CACIAM 69d]|nr:MAG: acyl-CoA thioesterase [Limnothrix sp. CACIAM 69d]